MEWIPVHRAPGGGRAPYGALRPRGRERFAPACLLRGFELLARGFLVGSLVASQALWAAGSAAGDWRFLFQEGDIRVYRTHEKPPSFKAEGELGVDVFQALAVLADIDRRPEWVANLREIRLVEGNPESQVVLYSVFDLPWPFKDRDSVTRGKIDIDYERREVVVRFGRITHPDYPEREDRVRIPVTQGRYLLRYLDDDSMFAAYELQIDSGGHFPRWIVNLFIKRAPLRTLESFQQQVVRTRGEYGELIERHRRLLAEYHQDMR